MRFLQIVSTTNMSGPADPEHMAKVRESIRAQIERGELLAAGSIGKRATVAARVVQKDGKITVEDPPRGDGWMAAGGYSLNEYASKEDAIAAAKAKFAIMGDGVVELIQVSELYPRPSAAPQPAAQVALPAGVIPYLNIDGAGDASAFYQKAFAAKEIARMPAQDGKRVMHCQLEINGGALMLSDNFADMGMPPIQRSSSYTMQLVVADGDLWWSRAIAAGCKERLPFAVAPWGDKYGQFVDPFGVSWAINSPAGAPTK
jgi:uncharacterized glyoxalase superfamily protein PhnB